MKHSTIAKTFTAAAATILALAMGPSAQAQNKGCSAGMLRGTFAYTSIGAITAPPELAGPFGEIGTQYFDGTGGTTGSATLSTNGSINQVTVTGTYTVNADCTGTMTLLIQEFQATVHVTFVIANGGDEFQAIETETGFVITRLGHRLFPGKAI